MEDPAKQVPDTEIHKARYRTRDGAADYVFSFERASRGWQIFVDSQPSYRDRPDDSHSTHRGLENNRYMVDIIEPLESLSDAKIAAAIWADATQEYIKTGKIF